MNDFRKHDNKSRHKRVEIANLAKFVAAVQFNLASVRRLCKIKLETGAILRKSFIYRCFTQL
ncbi:MAG: hypothetical protein IJ991_04280, partial [Thermoguttaceae bacterium]|nr:hypothetical protein [Thermoguttaceae bacterium]